jgi:hypothetical protein
MLLQGQVGPVRASDGSQTIVRQGRTSELIISAARSRYYETVSRGGTFALTCTGTATGVSAGNIVNAAAAAATQFALWNPVGSGVNLSLIEVCVSIVSATTMPAGPPFHGLIVGSVPTINSTVDSGREAKNSRAGSGAPRAKYVSTAAQSGTTLTGGSAPVTFRAMELSFSATGFTSAAGTYIDEHLDGEIVLPPGTGWLPLWASAGTSMLNAYNVVWEEIPI